LLSQKELGLALIGALTMYNCNRNDCFY